MTPSQYIILHLRKAQKMFDSCAKELSKDEQIELLTYINDVMTGQRKQSPKGFAFSAKQRTKLKNAPKAKYRGSGAKPAEATSTASRNAAKQVNV